MEKKLDGRLRLIGWLGSLLVHLLLIMFAAPFLLRSPQFTVTTGETSTEIELTAAAPKPKVVTPSQPQGLPPPLVPPLPSLPPLVIPPPKSPAKLRPAHKMVTAESSSALKGAVEAQPDDLHNDPPVYPDDSRIAHEEGVVILRVEVTATGEAASVSIKQSSGFFRLDQAARQAVKHWKFHPGLMAGLPVSSEADVPVHFKLE